MSPKFIQAGLYLVTYIWGRGAYICGINWVYYLEGILSGRWGLYTGGILTGFYSIRIYGGIQLSDL